MAETGCGLKSQWCSTRAGSSARSPRWHSWQYNRPLYSHLLGPCSEDTLHRIRTVAGNHSTLPTGLLQTYSCHIGSGQLAMVLITPRALQMRHCHLMMHGKHLLVSALLRPLL